MKIRPVGVALFQAERRTDIKKLIVGLAILRTRLEFISKLRFSLRALFARADL